MSGKIQSTVDYNTENITLLVNPDENGNAYGELYHDDGDGYDFKMVILVLLVLNAPP